MEPAPSRTDVEGRRRQCPRTATNAPRGTQAVASTTRTRTTGSIARAVTAVRHAGRAVRDGPAGVHGVLDQAAVGVAPGRRAARPDPATRRRRAHARSARSRATRVRSRCSRSARHRGAQRSARRSSNASGAASSRCCAIHSATDSCYGWNEYGALVGARFDGHPWTQTFTADVLRRRPIPRARTSGRRVAVARRGVPVPRSARRRAGAPARARRRARSRRRRCATARVRLPARVVLRRRRGPRVLDEPRPLPRRVGVAGVPAPPRGRTRLGARRDAS